MSILQSSEISTIGNILSVLENIPSLQIIVTEGNIVLSSERDDRQSDYTKGDVVGYLSSLSTVLNDIEMTFSAKEISAIMKRVSNENE